VTTSEFGITSWLTTQTPDHEEHLYHYTSAEDLQKILHSSALRLGPLSSTNDPAENKEWVVQLFFSSAHSGSTDVGTDELDSVIHEIDRMLRRNACLGCFTIDREPKPEGLGVQHFHMGWARARMWQQYGSAHRGACLIFNRTDFLECVERSNFQSGETREHSFGRVLYFDKPLDVRIALDSIRRRGVSDLLEDLRTNTGIPASLYFRKNTDWESEVEFRVVSIRTSPQDGQDDMPMMIPYKNSLEGIVVGEHFHDSTINPVHGVAGVPVFRCVWLDGAPTLTPM
jgi:hypothetical protein